MPQAGLFDLARARRRGRSISKLAAAELDRLRSAAKRLHYAATFFAAAFQGWAALEWLKATETLPDTLGL
jgi:hypothetical protein